MELIYIYNFWICTKSEGNFNKFQKVTILKHHIGPQYSHHNPITKRKKNCFKFRNKNICIYPSSGLRNNLLSIVVPLNSLYTSLLYLYRRFWNMSLTVTWYSNIWLASNFLINWLIRETEGDRASCHLLVQLQMPAASLRSQNAGMQFKPSRRWQKRITGNITA